jgi:hypothetical protein
MNQKKTTCTARLLSTLGSLYHYIIGIYRGPIRSRATLTLVSRLPELVQAENDEKKNSQLRRKFTFSQTLLKDAEETWQYH